MVPEVTKACLTCHNKAGHQFQKSIHWTWEYKNEKTGQTLGKRNLVNNFCTNARGNEGMCAMCHAGYNWTNANFDFSKQENIDCLVCHEQTGTYYKTPPTKGNAACSIMFEGLKPIDWTKVAQSVGRPERANCGTCHFNGGGGDGVKHGDLDTSLDKPAARTRRAHGGKGANFPCRSATCRSSTSSRAAATISTPRTPRARANRASAATWQAANPAMEPRRIRRRS